MEIFDIKNKIKESNQITVLTGAGISQESGIPTFRGKDGLWKNFKAEDLATPDAFSKNPKLVWEWYEMRREICQKANPNPAHYKLSEWESLHKNIYIITQNVDNLHKKAGSKNIIELHGNIFSVRCTMCNFKDNYVPYPLKEIPPLCPKCNSLLRPNVVWFGEYYNPKILEESKNILSSSDLVVIIGTSGNVSVPVYLALDVIHRGVFSIEINPEESSITQHVNVYIKGKAGEIVPKLFDSSN